MERGGNYLNWQIYPYLNFFYLINKAKSFFLFFYMFFLFGSQEKRKKKTSYATAATTNAETLHCSHRRWQIVSWWVPNHPIGNRAGESSTNRGGCSCASRQPRFNLSRPRAARFLGLTSRSRANRWDLEIRGASRRFRVSIRLWRYLGLPCLFICFSSFDSGLFLGCLWLVFGL